MATKKTPAKARTRAKPSTAVKALGEFKAMASALIERTQLAARLGFQFGTDRDLYAVYGYTVTPVFQDYLARYCRQDIAARVVDAPAQAVWRNPPEVEGSASFNSTWETLVKKHKIWYNLERVDRLAGIGRYAVLLVGYNDGSDLDKPVSAGSEIIYLQPYSELSAQITEFDNDSTSPRFNKPNMYNVSISELKSSTSSSLAAPSAHISTKAIRVHHSRILHVAENPLEDEVFGNPRLQKVLNLFDDLLKVVGGSAETYWLTANRGIQVNVDKEMDLAVDDAAALEDEIKEYQHNLRRFIRTRGVDMNVLGTDTPNPKGPFDVIISLVSGATGIPRRILLGSEAGQLASEQDRANWAERIEERRGSFAQPVMLEPFIDMLAETTVLPQTSEDVEIAWPDAFHMSPLESAQTSAQMARSAANLIKQDPTRIITTVDEDREILSLAVPGILDGPAPEQRVPEPPSLPGGADEADEIDEDTREQIQDDDSDGPRSNTDTGTDTRPLANGEMH